MSTLESILNLLQKWPAWKRITQTPERVDDIERRMVALEQKLVRAPGETCPKCGEAALRAVSEGPARGPLAMVGVRVRKSRCEKCQFQTETQLKP